MDLAWVRGPKFSEFPGPQIDHVKHLLALILRFFVPLSGFDDCILLLLRITAFKDRMYWNNHVFAESFLAGQMGEIFRFGEGAAMPP